MRGHGSLFQLQPGKYAIYFLPLPGIWAYGNPFGMDVQEVGMHKNTGLQYRACGIHVRAVPYYGNAGWKKAEHVFVSRGIPGIFKSHNTADYFVLYTDAAVSKAFWRSRMV